MLKLKKGSSCFHQWTKRRRKRSSSQCSFKRWIFSRWQYKRCHNTDQTEAPKIEGESGVLADAEMSEKSESETSKSISYNQQFCVGPHNEVQTTTIPTFSHDVWAPHVSPRKSVGPRPPRPSRNPVPRKRRSPGSDVKKKAETVKPNTKILSMLQVTKQNLKSGILLIEMVF